MNNFYIARARQKNQIKSKSNHITC